MDQNAAFVQENEIITTLLAGNAEEINEMKEKFNQCLSIDLENTLQVGEKVISSILSELDDFMASHPIM